MLKAANPKIVFNAIVSPEQLENALKQANEIQEKNDTKRQKQIAATNLLESIEEYASAFNNNKQELSHAAKIALSLLSKEPQELGVPTDANVLPEITDAKKFVELLEKLQTNIEILQDQSFAVGDTNQLELPLNDIEDAISNLNCFPGLPLEGFEQLIQGALELVLTEARILFVQAQLANLPYHYVQFGMERAASALHKINDYSSLAFLATGYAERTHERSATIKTIVQTLTSELDLKEHPQRLIDLKKVFDNNSNSVEGRAAAEILEHFTQYGVPTDVIGFCPHHLIVQQERSLREVTQNVGQHDIEPETLQMAADALQAVPRPYFVMTLITKLVNQSNGSNLPEKWVPIAKVTSQIAQKHRLWYSVLKPSLNKLANLLPEED